LQHYALPGRKAEFSKQVERGRQWLWTVKPQNNENRVYQLLGLAWSGESALKLQPLAKALVSEQRPDGGVAIAGHRERCICDSSGCVCLEKLPPAWRTPMPAVERDNGSAGEPTRNGTWHGAPPRIPFQPTMNSGFPHGKDSWISRQPQVGGAGLSSPETTPSVAWKR